MSIASFGERLRRARRDADVTQVYVALPVGDGTLFHAEHTGDTKEPDFETVQKLAELLGVTPGWLAFGEAVALRDGLTPRAPNAAYRRSGPTPAQSKKKRGA